MNKSPQFLRFPLSFAVISLMKSSLTASLFISLRDTGSSLIVCLCCLFSTSFSDLRAAITVSSKVFYVLGMSLDNPSACPILFVDRY